MDGYTELSDAAYQRMLDQQIAEAAALEDLERGPNYVKPKFVFEDLVAQCDFTVPLSADEIAWMNIVPVGDEII